MRILLLAAGLFCAATASAAELRPFKTDGCTGYADGTRKKPGLWKHCCVEHDLGFWAGGDSRERRLTDERLRDCIAATGEKLQAEIIYLGVRLGSYSPMKIRGMQWGNAWSPWATRKEKLLSGEIDSLEDEILREIYDPILGLDQRRDFIDRLRARVD